MKRLMSVWTIAALAVAVAAGSAMGQGPNNARQSRPNAVAAPRAGQGTWGAGGWWNRVTPQTPQQKAFVNEVAGLNNRLRVAMQEERALVLQNAPAARIQAKQQEAATLRRQIQQLTTTKANQALLLEMGVPAGYGVCDGSGPVAGQGWARRGGMGRGMAQGARNGAGPGRGMAQGPRNGAGPGRGMAVGPRNGSGPGRGMRLGPQDGSGPNPNCPVKTR